VHYVTRGGRDKAISIGDEVKIANARQG
jgi:hypothetical protein